MRIIQSPFIGAPEAEAEEGFDFFLPDIRFECPDLFIPGKKPNCEVEVDKEHFAADGFVHGLDFTNSLLGLLKHRPLVTESTAAAGAGTYATQGTLKLGVLGGSRCMITAENDTSDNYINCPLVSNWDWGEVQGKAGSVGGDMSDTTFLISFYQVQNSSADEYGIFQVGADTGVEGLYVYTTTAGRLRVAWGSWNGDLACDLDTVPLKQWTNLVITASPSNYIKVFTGGALIGESQLGEMDVTATFNVGNCFAGAYSNSLYGGIRAWNYWRKCLPEAGARSLSDDLYQFLIPR